MRDRDPAPAGADQPYWHSGLLADPFDQRGNVGEMICSIPDLDESALALIRGDIDRDGQDPAIGEQLPGAH